MLIRWLIASIHLLAFAVTLSAIFARARAFRMLPAPAALASVLRADNAWGLSALVLIVTGLMRVFGGFEKGADYYLHQPFFHAKMGLLALILLLEIWPMTTLIGWRVRQRRSTPIDMRYAPLFARISRLQGVLVIGMVFAAVAMARGWR